MSRPTPASRIKTLSEKKREREVLQYVAAYRDLPRLDELDSGPDTTYLPTDHLARPSTDSTLTALCQLAALRLNAKRALISLIDDERQHVLAEATPRSSLRGGAPPGDGTNALWLGRVSIPRSWGVCEQVLAVEAAIDMHNGPMFETIRVCDFTLEQLLPGGIPDEDVSYLEDLAGTVIEYLGNYTVSDRFRRGEKLTRGLISFAEGASALLPLDNANTPSEPHSPTTTISTLGSDTCSKSLQDALADAAAPSRDLETAYAASQVSRAGSQGFGETQKNQQLSAALQDTILPMNSRAMFARAANVMLASSDLDGVLILDASVAATGHRQHPAAPEREGPNDSASDSAVVGSKSESSEDSSSHSSNANKSANSSSAKKCGVLGAAPSRPIVNADGTPGAESLAETNLARLLLDLAYFNIFSHSVMRELSRLDAIALNQQKTTFVASISHELRSPLHGILGTLEFIRDTPLDTFQTSMLNSLNSCGQTLLDTINHLMDHSKMSETTKNVSTRRLKDTKTVRLSSKPLKTRRVSKEPAFDLSLATEEVVEAVFAGSSFLPIMSSKNAPLSPTESTTTSTITDLSDFTTKRKTCYIILDVGHEQDWIYCFPVGSWKRTVMNLFGNAVKYTQTGHIVVSLHAVEVARTTGSQTTITLTVTDTGSGMSPVFLANKAFQPFSQEDPHTSGVGLGLSIVRQIIETNGGKIEISSDHTFGTKITVKLSLIRPEAAQIPLPQRSEYRSWLPRLKGLKVCILQRVHADQEVVDEPQNAEGLAKFTKALTMTLADHLNMDVVQTTEWEGNDCDLVICPEPSFDYLKSIREKRADIGAAKAAITIFVALDALEAATLRSDVRVVNKESVVEIITQPLGPYKLAYVLNKCLDRFEQPGENVQRPPDPDRAFEVNLPQSNSTRVKHPSAFSSPVTTRALSPPTVEMPPLLDQPHWHATDKPEATSSPLADSDDPSTSTSAKLIVEERELPIRPRLTTPSQGTGATSNILITDDNVINRRLLVAFMKKYKLQYTEAENGLEAVRAYQSSPEKFDVILMDMSMPVMDGMTATRTIRQYEQEYNTPRCCIIALTGLASASAKLEAWNSGIDHFMTKPINFKALEKFLKKEETRRYDAAGAAKGAN
ncbi:hypothetical protein E8E12_005896 [Didymella heteroderae]|uniref:Phosphorelay sensor kinase n=1 Tax=Didymella heteroderae TaxID=1769908 RepID=A0A9P5BZG8_9PLEO|nr:hypothetical protein E8E12_005896 [Didymella heteroderae]